MPAGKFNAGKVFLTVCMLILLSALAYGVIDLNRKVPLQRLPNPNGCDDFLKAQKLMVGNPADFERGSVDELRQHLAENDEVLKLVRAGLTKQCRVSISFSTNYLALRSLSDVKKVARLLEAEGRLAEWDRRTNDAARIYMETIRYGAESCRGGLMIDRLVGIACKTIGADALQKILGALDAQTCRALGQQLREIARRQESVTDVLRNEKEWVRQTFPLSQRIRTLIPIEWLNPMKRVQNLFVKQCNQSELQLRRLMIDFATRAYKLEHGQPPKSPNQLVPDYLDSAPPDPTTAAKSTN
jgi:hypothetical protein